MELYISFSEQEEVFLSLKWADAGRRMRTAGSALSGSCTEEATTACVFAVNANDAQAGC